MHGRLAIALLALPLLVPAPASAAVEPGRDIRKLDAFTASAGALVRVTLRAPLEGRISVRFERRDGVKGSIRRSAVIRGRKRIDFVFAGDARALRRVIVRTAPRGDHATLRMPARADDCAALARLGRKLRRAPQLRHPGPLHGPAHRQERPRPGQHVRPRGVRARPRHHDGQRRRRPLPRPGGHDAGDRPLPVPSWARSPAQVNYSIPAGPCDTDVTVSWS